MSQKKMEAYKEAKKNVKQTRKKEKRNRIIAWIVGILIAAVLIGASVFLVYYTNVIKPKQDEAKAAATLEDAGTLSPDDAAADIADYLKSNGGTDITDSADVPATENTDAAESTEEAPATETTEEAPAAETGDSADAQ